MRWLFEKPKPKSRPSKRRNNMDTANLNDGGCRFWLVMDYKGRDFFVGRAYVSPQQALTAKAMAGLLSEAQSRFKNGLGQPNFPELKRKSKAGDDKAYMWVIGAYGGETRVVCYRFKSTRGMLKDGNMAKIGKLALKAFKISDKTIDERVKESKVKKVDHIVFDTNEDGKIWEVKDEKKKQEILDPSLSPTMVTKADMN